MPRVCFPNRLRLRPDRHDQNREHVCGDEAGDHGRRDGARWRRRHGHDVLNAMVTAAVELSLASSLQLFTTTKDTRTVLPLDPERGIS